MGNGVDTRTGELSVPDDTHVVRLIDGEDHTKDIDFSQRGIRERWETG